MDMTIDQQVALDEALTPFFKAFLVTADVPEIYIGEIRRLTDVNINKLHQPWRSFAAIINKCLSGKSSGYDILRLSQALFLWGFYHKRNVDFAYLLWEDFVYQVEHKDTKKSNEMYYSRFTKNTQQFGAMLPIELTNADIKNSDAYKEYYVVATGATPPKTKASIWKTKSSFDTIITPPSTAAAGTRFDERDDDDDDEKGDDDDEEGMMMMIKRKVVMMSKLLMKKFAGAVSSILRIVQRYMDQRMNEAVKVAVQIQSDRLCDEAQAKNEEFFKTINENMQKIIKEKVKEQVKILIEKIEGNNSIHRSNEEKNLYKALVKAYESDKIILHTYGDTVTLKRRRDDDDDKDEEPSAGSDQGSKRRRERNEPDESATVEEPMHTTHEMEEPSHPEFETGSDDQPIAEPSQHPEWFSQQKKPPTPDRDWNKTLSVTHGSIQPWISELAKQTDSRSSFNELMDTPVDFSAFLMNWLKVDTLTRKLLAGPTYELMKGSYKIRMELEFFLEEPLPLIPNSRGRRVIPFDHFINNDLEYLREGASSRYDKHAVNRESARDVYSKRKIITVTELKIIEWHNYKYLDWITVRRDDDKLYKFKEGDFKRLRIQDIEDMLLLLACGRPSTRCRKLPEEAQPHKAGYINELHKFSDGTLTDVRTTLDDRLKGIRMKYLPQTIWRKSDKDRVAAMIQAIDKQPKTKRIMRSLERVEVILLMEALARCDELRRAVNSPKWEDMFILYCHRAISEYLRLASETIGLCAGLTVVIENRDSFIDQLDILANKFMPNNQMKLKICFFCYVKQWKRKRNKAAEGIVKSIEVVAKYLRLVRVINSLCREIAGIIKDNELFVWELGALGDKNPIRTLGDYFKPSHEGYRNTIELLVGNNVRFYFLPAIRLWLAVLETLFRVTPLRSELRFLKVHNVPYARLFRLSFSALEMLLPGHAVGKVMGRGRANVDNIRKYDQDYFPCKWKKGKDYKEGMYELPFYYPGQLRWPPRVTLGRLLPHARGLGFKPRRRGFPSGAKKEWGLSLKAKVRVMHTAQLDVTRDCRRPPVSRDDLEIKVEVEPAKFTHVIVAETEDARLILTVRGCLTTICKLITQEVSNVESLERSPRIDISQGFILHKLIELLGKILDIPNIRSRFLREQFLSEVLEALIVIRGLIMQKTKLINDCKWILKDLLDSLLLKNAEKKHFSQACIGGLQIHEEKSGRRSITTWEDLTTHFLIQLFPLIRTTKLRNDILMFQQHHGESLSEAWTRFRDLLQKVPHHGIDLWLQVQIFYDHVILITRRTIDQSARDVPSTSNHRLIELENQVQRLMEAHLAPMQPTQVNKLSHVRSAVVPMTLIIAWKIPNKPLWNTHPREPMRWEPTKWLILYHSSNYQTKLEKALIDFDAHQEERLSSLRTQLEQQQDDMISKINLICKVVSEKLDDAPLCDTAGGPIAQINFTSIDYHTKEELQSKGIKILSKLLSPKYLSQSSIIKQNKNLSSLKCIHFVNLIVILNKENEAKEEGSVEPSKTKYTNCENANEIDEEVKSEKEFKEETKGETKEE
nr:auxin transport protein BIG [Tanacetum cinerariifolium]